MSAVTVAPKGFSLIFYSVIFLCLTNSSFGAGNLENFCSNQFKMVSAGHAVEQLTSFVRNHAAVKKKIDGKKIRVEDIVEGTPQALELTTFRAMHDIYIYSRTVTKAFEVAEALGVSSVHDLGSGSSIPTIAPILRGVGKTLKITGVDIDPFAISVSRKNVENVGFNAQYNFIELDMQSYLKQLDTSKPLVLISNPPYLPFPKKLAKDYIFADGGLDGARYLKDILNTDFANGTIVGINFSTLSNPKSIIEKLEKDYEVLQVEYYQVGEGKYTEIPEVKEFLTSNPHGVFSIEKDGKLAWGIIGVVAKKK